MVGARVSVGWCTVALRLVTLHVRIVVYSFSWCVSGVEGFHCTVSDVLAYPGGIEAPTA